jgi:hypothetical protein
MALDQAITAFVLALVNGKGLILGYEIDPA